ncbi:MAG TPA: glycerol kinase GlpK [Acidobacteriaceae bacterium]|jgi:glycerol kinase
MSGGYILAVDQGTTNTKGLLVGREGKPVFRASASVKVRSPRAGWVEQDPMELWTGVCTVIQQCLADATRRGGLVEGVAISNQRETVVAWDRATSTPVAPAILWQCRRSAAICEELAANHREQLLRDRTGLGIDPLFSASKMRWLLENIPGARERAATGDIRFGTVDSWLIWMLTQGKQHACDVSNASRTQLLNLKTTNWDHELVELFGIPRIALPTVNSSSGVFGECSGIQGLEGVPIVSTMGDSHAAMAGHVCFCPGSVKATYGTGSSLMTLMSGLQVSREKSKLATTVAWSLPGSTPQYALEGNISMTGAAVQWVGEFLNLADPVNDAVALAASVDDSDGVYFVPAMLGLGAPHWDSNARGTVTGLGRTSRTAHLARAAVEAIAFQIRDVLAAMVEESGCDLPELHVDGGATRNDWLMQFQADILGRPVVRSGNEDLSALGSAWFGGLALGWWKTLADLSALPSDTATFYPQMEREQADVRYAGWKLAVRRTRLREVEG